MKYDPTSQESFGENTHGNRLVLIVRGLDIRRVLHLEDIIDPSWTPLHGIYSIVEIRLAKAVRAWPGNKVKSPIFTKPFEKAPGLPGARDVT